MSESPLTGTWTDEVSDSVEHWQVRDTRQIAGSRIVSLRQDDVVMPDGRTATRDVVVHPGAVGVVCLDDEDRILLLRQYRHPVGRMLWEPPAGLLDEPGEDPRAAAARELVEEAGLAADTWHVLVDLFTSPGMTDEAVRLYLARGLSEVEGGRPEGIHEETDLPTRWLPVDDAVELVLAGRLHNPLAVSGVLAVAAARHRGLGNLRPASEPWPERPVAGSKG